MNYEVIIEAPAQLDIEEAYIWTYGVWGSSQAQAWYDGIIVAIRSLSRFPKREALALENDLFDEEIRQLLYGRGRYRYRVLFTIRGKRVHVLHVRHSARDRWVPQS